MRITSHFDSWLLGDGCYPPLECGQFVNLAFQLRPMSVRAVGASGGLFESRSDGTCLVTGTVTRGFPMETTPIAVVESPKFRCYVEDEKFTGWPVGSIVEVSGDISVDYYIWSEIVVRHYPDAPDLFYPLRVERIRRVLIPERFIARSESGLSAPTSVDLADVDPSDIVDVRSMDETDARQPVALDTYRPAFFLLDLSDRDMPDRAIPRTFLE